MKKISFTDYIHSKEQLREAVKRTPQKTVGYKVKRYCRLMVQNSEGKQYLALNPGHIVKVIWLYEKSRKPLPIRIFFEGVKTIDPESRFYTSWGSEKLASWLDKNTSYQ